MAIYRGVGSVSKMPAATVAPPVDLAKVLDVDTANPFLRDLRIQQGFLNKSTLPAEFAARVAQAPLLTTKEGK